MATPLLLIKSLVVNYAERAVLNGINLTLSAGEIASLQGPSGSGKSTFFNCLAGIQEANQGSIILNGAAYENMTEHEKTELRRSRVSSIFQFFHLLPTLTAYENIAFAAHVSGIKPSEVKTATEALLSEVQIMHRKDALPSEMSGGEQQRVAIARSLITQPDLILADEPTGNLDQKTSKIILELLLKECRKNKITLLLATHDNEIATACDRQLHLTDGQLVN